MFLLVLQHTVYSFPFSAADAKWSVYRDEEI